MNYRILLFSDNFLSGQSDFSLPVLFGMLAKNNLACSEFFSERIDIEKNSKTLKSALETGENILVFCENEHIDNLLLKNIQLLGNQKELIEELAISFQIGAQCLSVIPIDLDWQKFTSIVLDKAKMEGFKYCKFHLFGRDVADVLKTLQTLHTDNASLSYSVQGKGILTDIYACYQGGTTLIDDEQVKIASIFRDNLYSENDLSLPQIVLELLRLKNLKLAVQESITGGNLTAQLFKDNKDFSTVLKCSEIIPNPELVDAESVYTAAVSFLKTTGADLAVVVHGNADATGMTCFIAIGDKSTVHVYKNRFNAERSVCCEMATASALFHLVKKLRQNDFVF